jgi:tRNA G18 (ribose-2'-O)-methylase SpoU
MEDSRNVVDAYKGVPLEEIVADLDTKGTGLEIAIENLERDFNMGTIVRTANAFGVRTLHVIGRKQWNKRGAMATDKYLHVIYHANAQEFMTMIKGKQLIAFDNVVGSSNLSEVTLPADAVLLFGAEGPGISQCLLSQADQTVAIEQFGSTRSINVGVAAGIAMYAWVTQNVLCK